MATKRSTLSGGQIRTDWFFLSLVPWQADSETPSQIIGWASSLAA
jgi:hypothetical protein